ncbi:MAG: zinc-binding dehydrogenase [bacterium]
MQEFIDAVESGDLRVTIDRTFKLDEIVEAHKYMESNQAKGKSVVEI